MNSITSEVKAFPLTIIILNYNGTEDTLNCVQGLRNHLPQNSHCEIVVVDNASSEQNYKELKMSLDKDVTLIRSEVNAGFAAGNNIGINYALEKGDGYICLLNNDTIIESDFLTPCVEALNNDSKAAFVSPAIIDYHSGNYQNTGGNFLLMRAKVQFLNKNMKTGEIQQDNIICDMIAGCCMVFRTSLIKEIGLLPEYYFMYYEETEWCYRAKKRGLHCVSLTSASIIHKGKASIGGKSELTDYMLERNRIVFAKKCMRRLQFAAFLVFDFLRSIYRAIIEKEEISKYIKWHFDGVANKVNTAIFTIPNADWRYKF